jgi:hypothetical protein
MNADLVETELYTNFNYLQLNINNVEHLKSCKIWNDYSLKDKNKCIYLMSRVVNFYFTGTFFG